MARRIAITGVGAVSALGPDVRALLAGVVEGRCGIRPVTRFPTPGRGRVAAEVDGLAIGVDLDPATVRRLSSPDRFAVRAVDEACVAAGLDPGVRARAALVVGGTTGGMADTETAYARRRGGDARRWRLSRVIGLPQSTAAAVIAQALGIHGPRITVSTACSSSALAIGLAAEAILRGDAAVAVAVGTDGLCRLTWAGFDALQALDPEPCRPFDRTRGGLSLGEGAGALVLEDVEHARARGAHVIALLAGWATSTDAHHVTAPHPDGRGAEAAMRAALETAGVRPDEVDYVNAHGSATPQNDAVEVGMLCRVLSVDRRRVPVSSSKSQFGHTLGAAGALEAVVTLLAIERGIVPPTVHCTTPEWGDIDFVREAGRRQPIRVATSSSYGFGGHNVTLVFAHGDAP